MIEPFLTNMDIIIRTIPGASYSGSLEDHTKAWRCTLCVYIQQEWERLRPKACTYAEVFTTHRHCVVIPFSPRENLALYLPFTEAGPARIEAFDFDNPPADVVYVDEPTLAAKATGLAKAMFDWAKAGFQLAPSDIYEQRLATCTPCESWSGDAFLGTGKCSKCGCSGVKLKLATSKCPIGKWNAVNNS